MRTYCVPIAASAQAVPAGTKGVFKSVLLLGGSAAAGVRVYRGIAIVAANLIGGANSPAGDTREGKVPVPADKADDGVPFDSGLYVELTGVGAVALVYYGA